MCYLQAILFSNIHCIPSIPSLSHTVPISEQYNHHYNARVYNVEDTTTPDVYEKGEGVKQDYKEAFEWFRKAAEQGNTKAQFNLGLMYYKGQGVKQDYTEAAKWYRKAAAQGYAAAQSNLVNMYKCSSSSLSSLTPAGPTDCDVPLGTEVLVEDGNGGEYRNSLHFLASAKIPLSNQESARGC